MAVAEPTITRLDDGRYAVTRGTITWYAEDKAAARKQRDYVAHVDRVRADPRLCENCEQERPTEYYDSVRWCKPCYREWQRELEELGDEEDDY